MELVDTRDLGSRDASLGGSNPSVLAVERWPSGLRRFPAKKERFNSRRGFKSLLLRFPPIAQLVECLCEEQEVVSSILTWGIALPYSSMVEQAVVNR